MLKNFNNIIHVIWTKYSVNITCAKYLKESIDRLSLKFDKVGSSRTINLHLYTSIYKFKGKQESDAKIYYTFKIL